MFDFKLLVLPPLLIYRLYSSKPNKNNDLIAFVTLGVLWVVHIGVFIVNRYSFKNNLHEKVIVDENPLESLTVVSHYKPVIHEFETNKYFWIAQGILYIGWFSYYKTLDEISLLFEVWMPLDFLMFLAISLNAFIQNKENER